MMNFHVRSGCRGATSELCPLTPARTLDAPLDQQQGDIAHGVNHAVRGHIAALPCNLTDELNRLGLALYGLTEDHFFLVEGCESLEVT